DVICGKAHPYDEERGPAVPKPRGDTVDPGVRPATTLDDTFRGFPELFKFLDGFQLISRLDQFGDSAADRARLVSSRHDQGIALTVDPDFRFLRRHRPGTHKVLPLLANRVGGAVVHFADNGFPGGLRADGNGNALSRSGAGQLARSGKSR